MTKQPTLRIALLLCLNCFLLNLFAQNKKDGITYLNEALEHKKIDEYYAAIADFERAMSLYALKVR